MAEGAVEDGFVTRPKVPFAGIGAELDVRDGAQLGRLLQLLCVDLVIRGERPRRSRVGRANVDERHSGSVGSERVAHHRHPGLGVCDDRPLARLEPSVRKGMARATYSSSES